MQLIGQAVLCLPKVDELCDFFHTTHISSLEAARIVQDEALVRAFESDRLPYFLLGRPDGVVADPCLLEKRRLINCTYFPCPGMLVGREAGSRRQETGIATCSGGIPNTLEHMVDLPTPAFPIIRMRNLSHDSGRLREDCADGSSSTILDVSISCR